MLRATTVSGRQEEALSKANSSASTTRAAIPRVVDGSAEMAITYPLWHDYFRTRA
jgi:hypothetical protein